MILSILLNSGVLPSLGHGLQNLARTLGADYERGRWRGELTLEVSDLGFRGLGRAWDFVVRDGGCKV